MALLAMQICLAKGAHVYVTSGNAEKISKAVSYGAKGGANYKDGASPVKWPSVVLIRALIPAKWPAEIGKLLSANGATHLDAIVDSAGGDIMSQTGKILKQGGRVVCYGMYARILHCEFINAHTILGPPHLLSHLR